MTKFHIPKSLRELVRQRAEDRCEYCQTPAWLNGLAHEIDHIIPRSEDGASAPENLCLACSACNGYKQAKTSGIDPETGRGVPLFHPRRQKWSDHFMWNIEGTQIAGVTPCGRVTIESLRLNNSLIVTARRIWVRTGFHPPQ